MLCEMPPKTRRASSPATQRHTTIRSISLEKGGRGKIGLKIAVFPDERLVHWGDRRIATTYRGPLAPGYCDIVHLRVDTRLGRGAIFVFVVRRPADRGVRRPGASACRAWGRDVRAGESEASAHGHAEMRFPDVQVEPIDGAVVVGVAHLPSGRRRRCRCSTSRRPNRSRSHCRRG